MSSNVAQISDQTDPNKDPNNPEWEKTRVIIQNMLDNKTITQKRLSKESGNSETALNQFLNRKESNTRYDRVNDRLLTWLDTYTRRAEMKKEIPDGPGFILTPTANRIIQTLEYAHVAPDMAIIYGASGVGKTETFREYARNNPNVCIATMTPSHATVSKSLQEIGKCQGLRQMRDSASLYDAICESLKDRNAILIIDEAQNLGNKSLDQIRQIHDKVNCGVVFAGNDQVYTNMSGRRAEYLDRVYSRVGMKTRLNRASQKDAEAIIHGWGITDKVCTGILLKVSTKPGALRLVSKVIKFAYLISQGDQLESRHIRCALKRLNLEVA